MTKEQGELRHFVEQFLIGGVSAAISKTITAPIEVVKLRMQLQPALLQKGLILKPYYGTFECFRRLYSEEGFIAYFRGNGTNVLRYFPTQALNFSFKGLFQNLMKDHNPNKKNSKTLLINIVSGGIAGAITQIFVYPLDFARTRLANDKRHASTNSERQFDGLTDCLKKTYSSDGLLGLYRGFMVSCVCMIIYRGLYFGMYDSIRPELTKRRQESMLAIFLLSYSVTIFSGVLSYPFDTIRRRMMMTSGESKKFKGSFDCAKTIYQEKGLISFFRGGSANILGGLTGAGVLLIYDKLKNFCLSKKTINF